MTFHSIVTIPTDAKRFTVRRRARGTASVAVTVLRLGKEVNHKDTVLKMLNEGQGKDGGYGTAPGQESTVSGTYYASIILHWLEEK